MIETLRQRTLPYPPERLWSIIESVERLPEWFVGYTHAELISGAGLGRRQRVSGQWGAKVFLIEQTIIAYEPGLRLGWKHDSEWLDSRPAPKISKHTESWIKLESDPAGAGTRVRLISRQTPSNIFAGVIIRRVAAKRMGASMQESLSRLEVLAEKLSP
jgi:uncharacterized protein YndB with AHSA1/START domain